MDGEVQVLSSISDTSGGQNSSESEKIAIKVKAHEGSHPHDNNELASASVDLPALQRQSSTEDESRDSIQSHSTSISSLTASVGGPPRPLLVPPFMPDFPKRFSPKANREESPVKSGPDSSNSESPKEDEQQSGLHKTLSFRTDSTGSMGSLVSSLDLSTDGHEQSDRGSTTPDSSTSTPIKNHNTSSVSLLVSALKHNHKMKKKSVSFSLPSEDDIARRAKRKNSAMLYALENFDDAIPDYQITSPKASIQGSARKYASPDRAARRSSDPAAHTTKTPLPIVGIAALQLNEESSKEHTVGPAEEEEEEELPPKVGLTGSPLRSRKVLVVPDDVISRDHLKTLGQYTSDSQSQQRVPSSSNAGGIGFSGVGEQQEANELTLMQRVRQAKSPQELCEVFGITTESVFTGETLKKQFSRDILAKDRLVWIVPKTKSIHWAKNANDRLDAHKVKFFLLDKNSPHLNSASMLSTATSAKEEPLGKHGTRSPSVGADKVDQTNDNTGSGALPFSAIRAENDAGDSFSFPESDSPNISPALSPTAHSSNAAIETVVGAELFTASKSPRGRALPWTERAEGEMVGIIHSAVIHHLTIKIKTESGDYLSLKINSSKGNAVQRAKDWFTVIKMLTKDV